MVLLKCNLIFYSARRTGYCETAIRSVLPKDRYSISQVFTAFSPEMLGDKINESLAECKTVFIIGGIDRNDKLSTPDLLSKAFSKNSPLPKSEKLKIGKDCLGYKLRSLDQTIFLIPDIPEQITKIIHMI